MHRDENGRSKDCEISDLKFRISELEDINSGLNQCCNEFNEAGKDLVKCCECKQQVSMNMTESEDAPIHVIEGGDIVERDNTDYLCFKCILSEKRDKLQSDLQKANERIAELTLHIADIEKANDNCQHKIVKIETERDKLKQDLADAETVIGLYADARNYVFYDAGQNDLRTLDVIKDRGEKAREYLAKKDGKNG